MGISHRDFAQVKYEGIITKEVADIALDLMDVDKMGLFYLAVEPVYLIHKKKVAFLQIIQNGRHFSRLLDRRSARRGIEADYPAFGCHSGS